jgi:hypothetical protein
MGITWWDPTRVCRENAEEVYPNNNYAFLLAEKTDGNHSISRLTDLSKGALISLLGAGTYYD